MVNRRLLPCDKVPKAVLCGLRISQKAIPPAYSRLLAGGIASSGRLAQLARAPPLQGGGHRFEPCSAHSLVLRQYLNTRLRRTQTAFIEPRAAFWLRVRPWQPQALRVLHSLPSPTAQSARFLLPIAATVRGRWENPRASCLQRVCAWIQHLVIPLPSVTDWKKGCRRR